MIKVLSLFDGFSGGQLALRGLGIFPTRYYASEIDPFAVEVTQTNAPDIQIYKMLGNGWTIPVIEHIFSFAPFAQHGTSAPQTDTVALPV